MKKAKNNEMRPRTGRQKLFAAASMLLISALLLTGATFAWLTLALAPEVTGISTQIGANGSLEIALLTAETRQDLSKIQTGVGSSLASEDTTADVANTTWGNLIDVNSANYGLSQITLMPARLNVEQNPDGTYTVGDNLLSVPTYGYDGRIVELTDNTLSAIYDGTAFSGILGSQDYGVRAVGTSNAVTVQGSALALAKTNIVTYTNSAKTNAASAMTQNGAKLMNIVLAHSANSSATHDDNDKATLLTLLTAIQASEQYIEMALRQGLVAYAAASIEEEEVFTEVRVRILDSTVSLSALLDGATFDVPETFSAWVAECEEIKNNLNAAIIKCNTLVGGSYTWAQIREVMNVLMNLDQVYIGETLFGNMNANDFTQLMGTDFTMTLAPGSGVFADIADFTDDLTFWIAAMGSDVEVSTLTQLETPYLLALADAVSQLDAADGSIEGESIVKITDTYGYALDMAFRCNAPLSELLLQTEAIQRIHGDSSSPSTMGGGSYMEFSTDDLAFSSEQMLKLMDAVRVAFVDDMGRVLGIAKLNTSNRTILNGVITAPLYLYDFTVEMDEVSRSNVLVMGERRTSDNVITALDQNVAKAMTTLVWLDGDLVDNTMVSAESEHSLTGVLNLQFASSAHLVAAENSELLYLTPDKQGLSSLIEENRALFEAGQKMYTTVSWKEFHAAFEYAESVHANANANEMQIYAASTRLLEAAKALEETSIDVLKSKIEFFREMMGTTTDVARYVYHDAEAGRYFTSDTYTEEQKDQKIGDIYRVDYTKNLRDEGNGVKTPIYTDASWSNLAAALYDAEVLYQYHNNEGAVAGNPYTDFVLMDAALSALQAAYDALEFNVWFVPYEYEGALYYFAISDETDTYGKWYDANRQRIVSDLTILKLDAGAKIISSVAEIRGIPDYIEQGTFGRNDLSPYIAFTQYYPQLSDMNVLAVQWSVDDKFVLLANERQQDYLTDLISRANAVGLTEAAAAAQAVLDGHLNTDSDEDGVLDPDPNPFTLDRADKLIAELEPVVLDAEAKKAAEEGTALDPETTDMTSDQRTLLTTAINAAKAIEGYDDLEKTDLDALRNAVAYAEGLLAQEILPTMQIASDALADINAQLKEMGVKEVTAYNTLIYTLPMGSEVYDIAYAYDDGGTLLAVRQDGLDQTGTATVTAVVLTRDGVVLTVTKTVQVYGAAEGLQLTGVALNDTKSMTVGESDNIGVTLDEVSWVENGGLQIYSVREDIKTVTWATDDTKILSLEGSNSSCKVTALGTGTTTVWVSVETVQGNTYTKSVTVNVTAP